MFILNLQGCKNKSFSHNLFQYKTVDYPKKTKTNTSPIISPILQLFQFLDFHIQLPISLERF